MLKDGGSEDGDDREMEVGARFGWNATVARGKELELSSDARRDSEEVGSKPSKCWLDGEGWRLGEEAQRNLGSEAK
jgi:hypothetical protein